MASLTAVRPRRCSGGNRITASWKRAGMADVLSADFSTHSQAARTCGNQ